MDIRYIIFAAGCSILTFLYLYLSLLVVQQRRKYHLPYLTNDDKAFVARFRAHANFIEYVPLTLILMAISIVFQMHYLVLLVMMIALIIARIGHAYGLIVMERKKQFNFRFYSASTTVTIMAVLAIFNLVKAIYVLFLVA